MLPVVAEIIHVFEPFVRLEAKVRESDLVRTVGEADAALVSDTIPLSVNDKLVQIAKGLAAALENPQETDPSRLSSLGCGYRSEIGLNLPV